MLRQNIQKSINRTSNTLSLIITVYLSKLFGKYYIPSDAGNMTQRSFTHRMSHRTASGVNEP